MSWIKRNPLFFVGSLIAVLLMGVAGWYLYSKYAENNQILAKLDELYAELGRLNGENPHPGAGQVDNIKTAREQQQQVKTFIDKCRARFERIPAIPDLPKVNGQEFTTALRSTIARMQRDATNASVTLPADYSFSFAVQKPLVKFASGSLEPLSVQLGEVKAICEVLFQAKINSLDNLRRERVSADDATGPQTDYLDQKSITNELAVMTPYELSFRCFSSELAGVLAGFASSPHGIVVRTLNVEPAPAGTAETTTPVPGYAAVAPAPTPTPMPVGPGMTEGGASEAAAFARRYGLSRGGGGGPGGGGGGIPFRGLGEAAPPQQPIYPAPGTAPTTMAASAQARGGLPTVLDEKQLRITMTLQVVKLLPPAAR